MSSPYLTPEEFAREFPGQSYWPRGGKRGADASRSGWLPDAVASPLARLEPYGS